MDHAELKRKACEAVDRVRDDITDIARRIGAGPELGFKETRTAAIVCDFFRELGLPHKSGIALTGVRATLSGGLPGRTVAVMGELDAVVCPGHPEADPATGAAHACGHNAQIASMLGCAAGLTAVAQHLGGNVAFFAVPAEEMVELEYRNQLRKEGKIVFFGGKQELIRLGEMDGVDAAMMVHTSGSTRYDAEVSLSSLGFVAKLIRFIGREAHAGGSPHEGINALNAAMAALMCIHAQRETFRDEDSVRVHPIITKGGDLVNIVPADVRMETYVRARTPEAIREASRKVDRAVEGASFAVGAKSHIEDVPGYLPMRECDGLARLFYQNCGGFFPEDRILFRSMMFGSTDMGDLSRIMPVIQPLLGGAAGGAHSGDYRIADYEKACVLPAKIMAMTVIDLLGNHGEELERIRADYKPDMDKKSFIWYWEDMIGDGKA